MTRGVPGASGLGGRLARLSAGLAGAAVLIGAVTVLARVVGFVRYLVFSHTVGQTCLGAVYVTANLVPTVLFEAVLGGALVSIVVPLLSGPVGRGSREETERIASALLTWTLLVLLPLTVVVALLARPLIALPLGDPTGCPRGAAVLAGTRMLLIFAPQLVLYGVTVVLSGVLHAHRRFLGPALAPLCSSLVVIASYLLFSVVSSPRAGQGGSGIATGLAAELVLAVGTTVGVAALALTVVVPTLRAGLRLRPALSLPPGVAKRARALAAAGAATLAGQQLVFGAVMWLANNEGSRAAINLYNYAWQLFHLPYAALAVPIALSTFPALATRASAGDLRGYAQTVAATTRALVLVCCAAAGVLAAAATPVARLFLLDAPGGVPPATLARALGAFAPGLVGFGLVAHLGRALYASGNTLASAASVVTGWLVVLVADIVLALSVPARWVVAAFGVGNSLGMTVAGALLIVAVAVTGGRSCLSGLGRALAAGVPGGLAGYAAGVGIVTVVGPTGVWASVGACALSGLGAAGAFAAVAAVVDPRGVRAVLGGRLRRTG